MTHKEKELVEEMLDTITRIKSQTDYIDTHERIPQLELDAIVARIQKLYELSVALKYFHVHVDELLIQKQEILSEKNQLAIDEVVAGPEAEMEEEEYINAPNEVETTSTEETEEFIAELDVVSEDIEVKIDEAKNSLIDELNKLVPESAHDKLANVEDESVADKLMLQPIDNLKSAIEINDKFQFINELFAGNSDNYNKAIDGIDHSESLEDAISIIDNLNISERGEVYKSFLVLIERRFL